MEIYRYNKTDSHDLNLAIENNSLAKKNNDLKNTIRINLSFPSPYVTDIKKNDTVSCKIFIDKNILDKINGFRLYQNMENNIKTADPYKNTEDVKRLLDHLKKKTKLLIFIHGFSTNENKLFNYYKFIERIVNKKTSCLFINLPFHLERTPENETSGKRLIYFDDKDILYFFHQSVVDIRKSVDIIENLICPIEIDICGISLGAMVSVITKAIENRIKKTVLLLGGGYWEDIHWKGMLRFVLKGNCAEEGKISRKKCHEYYLNYFDFLDSIKKRENKIFTTDFSKNPLLSRLCTKKCFLCDPLTFAHMIKTEDVLMINSNMDHFFTRKSSKLLWNELGKPQIYWLNYPHFSSLLRNVRVINIISDFLYNKKNGSG